MSTATAPKGTDLNELPLVGELPVEHLLDISVELEPARLIPTPVGTRYILLAKAGRFEGPGLKGELVPGSGDWLNFGTDGIGRLNVHAILRTDDGALIQMEALGVCRVPTDAQEFADSYIRDTPKFETGDERYAWLNEVCAVGYNSFSPNHVDYRIYKIL
jgi:Protein of unknown function (DUF3237)